MLATNARGISVFLAVACTAGADFGKKSSGGHGWSEHVVWDDFSYGFGLQAVDVNGDGWLDLTAADTAAFVQLEPYANIDGDGRPDLLATSGTSRAVLWYRPSAQPLTQPWQRQVVDLTPGPREPMFAKLSDLNGDGRLDIVLAMRGAETPPGIAVWYEHAGIAEGRVQWRKHLIGEMRGIIDVAVGDIDGDGTLDLAACGNLPGEIAWFRNSGNPAARWTKHVIKANWPNANQVILADLDRDGRLDIASIADYGAMELRWWRNEGPAR